MGTKHFENYISILAIVNYREMLDALPPLTFHTNLFGAKPQPIDES